MNFKKLTIAAAIVAMTSLSVAPAFAQAAAPAAPAADAAAPAAPAADAAAPPADAAAAPEKKFWTSATLNEGVDKLPKNSVFRGIAEAGLKASTGGTTLVGLNDWIGMTLTRQLEDANARMQGGIAFLGSVGSVSPFVGLLGTVIGILNALIGIGVAGQMSIDKVAGPVGEALQMTAIGLFVAVPAVLLYNYLIRRNKVITEKLRAFAGDLQAYLISKSK
jgi:biopolymer transport protein ExbB